ncbi:xanthine dehydrogenase family protein molybdopterin-binding subunit [Duganella aceris]|uniref:Xanthine dehydrogenase family protein molybdopterin-binding subunit n=1 Tax=Duganella aceris TaxID=2703883 RepID=A0ABX0FNZ0_9BURK|nr:xanthine dehydrogenase family protein molybdopterin-binding subunit [Duganella aceris]NGZ86336.1 xanthine dehydrogenase family protein molybdopterin-binding subunit [Duganella aceris]
MMRAPIPQATSGAAPSRRAFLRLSAAVGGGMLLGFGLPGASRAARGAGKDAGFEGGAFIRIDTQGVVTLVMPKVEMGQGIYTAISMLIAEELEVPLSSLALAHAPPNEALYRDPLLASQMTGGSTSIRYAWEPMRRAGATARTLLVTAAAQRWKVDAAACHAERGEVVHAASGRRLGYGQLAAAAALLPVPRDVALKPPSQFKLIGTPAKRLDSREKVNGAARFGLDVRLPGMLYAAIVQSPVFGGRLASVDDTHARKVPGVRNVVRIDNAVAVIAEHTWAARSGAAALLLQWHEGPGAAYTTEAVVRELKAASLGPAGVARKDGDAAQAMSKAVTRVEAVYEQPFLAHAPMEPVNCTVHVRADACELWVGTQVPTRAVALAAGISGLPESRVTLHNFLLGGGFGRRLEVDFIGQAVRIGRLVDAPVKVFWTREQDIQQDMYRPYYYDTIAAGLDAAGKPQAWTHRITGSSIMARFAPPLYSKGVDADAVEVAAELPYRLPNQLIEFARKEPGAVPTAFWRGVGPGRSTFVVESFMDELAAAAGADPVRYRLDLLAGSPRARRVIETAARAAGWPGPAVKGRGRGVAMMQAFGTFIALVVEVTVDGEGEVRVNQVTCAVDCGLVVNPDTVTAQIEGGVMFGITAALYGEITIKDGRVEQSNFHDYRMLRIDQAPPVKVVIVHSGEAPGGIGEPGTAALPPALANAIYAATGKRLRKLPVGDQLKHA